MPPLLALRGELVLAGKSPDGDSIRFRPDAPGGLEELTRAWRIDLSRDGTVQLRLEGIDAPETHYGELAQPLGPQARDELLRWCGFSRVTWDGDVVRSSRPRTRRAAILAKLADANGRPVAFLVREEPLPEDGQWVEVGEALVRASASAHLLETGAAYLTLYDSCAREHRALLRSLAQVSRDTGDGVWGRDDSARFSLRDQDSIGPDGQLVLPKLFRRCSDYLKTRQPHETLPAWMRRQPEEDDQVLIGGRSPVPLSSLVDQRNRQIAFRADLLESSSASADRDTLGRVTSRRARGLTPPMAAEHPVAAWLVRHGEIPSHRGDLPVTPAGLAAAVQAGRALAASVPAGAAVELLHAPTLRTAQTAEAIGRGLAAELGDGARVGAPLRRPG